MDEIADPILDEEGLALLMGKERARARSTEGLENDF